MLGTGQQKELRKGDIGSSISISLDPSSESIDSVSITRNEHTGKKRVSRSFNRWCGLFHTRKRPSSHLETDDSHRRTTRFSSTVIMDLRSTSDFCIRHIPGSFSAPLPGLHKGLAGGDLFGDPQAVFNVWENIQKWLRESEVSRYLERGILSRNKVLILCYDGFASQLVSSIFRDRNVEAFPVQGGFPALYEQIQSGLRT